MVSPYSMQEWLIHRWSESFLVALLASPDGLSTTDPATPNLRFQFKDGGKWRGQIPKRLSAAGIILDIGAVKSLRTPRHGGLTTVWQLIDRRLAEQELERIRRWLADHPAPSIHPGGPVRGGFTDPRIHGRKQRKIRWPEP